MIHVMIQFLLQNLTSEVKNFIMIVKPGHTKLFRIMMHMFYDIPHSKEGAPWPLFSMCV